MSAVAVATPAGNAPPVLSIHGLPGLRAGARLDVAPGEQVLLVLPSRALRATLMARLGPADNAARNDERGQVSFMGGDLVGSNWLPRPGRAPAIAFVPPDGGLLANMNAWENIWAPVTYHAPEAGRELPWLVEGAFRELGLDASVAGKRPGELDLLTRRLVSLVRAVAMAPELIWVDSPFDELDEAELPRAARMFKLVERHLPFRSLVCACGAVPAAVEGLLGHARIAALELDAGVVK
jgi:ABC-type lipoprotein export system ATPase subunit